MKADKTIIRILHEIQGEILEEKGKKLSISELGKIVDSEIETVVFAIKKGLNVRLSHICNFVRINKKEVSEGKALIRSLKDTLNEEELKAKELELKLERIERQKKRNSGFNQTSLKGLLNTPNINNTATIFDDILLEDV